MKKFIVPLALFLLVSPIWAKSNPDGKIGGLSITVFGAKHFGDYLDEAICDEQPPMFTGDRLLWDYKSKIKGYTSSLSVRVPLSTFLTAVVNYNYEKLQLSRWFNAKPVRPTGCSVFEQHVLATESFHTIGVGIRLFIGQ